MSVDTPAQAGVSIDALLAAKEQRAARQADWLAHYQQPVISLTLVTPGAVKDSIRYRNMMGVALQAWRSAAVEAPLANAGSSGAMAADRARSAVVRSASGQRNQSDVQYAGAEPSAGTPVGYRCNLSAERAGGTPVAGRIAAPLLLCDEPAHACARSRRHDTDLVVARVEQMIDAWFARD